MIDHPIIFAIIIIFCSVIGVIGGTLGIFSFRWMNENKEFIVFLVNHFGKAINEQRKKNERNNSNI
jgi:hypothetical protein